MVPAEGLTTTDYLEAITDDGNRLTAAGRVAVEAPVEHCPGWTVEDLLDHVAGVYRFVAAIVTSGAADGPPRLEPENAPSGAAMVDYFADKHYALVTTLGATDADAPVWTWTPRNDAGYFFRRMTHESAVHRFDAENAVSPGMDPAAAVSGPLAVDGINEVTEVGMRFSVKGPRSNCYPKGTLHLHRTDGEGEWLLADAGGSLDVRLEHAKGDVALRGPASALFLYLWGRGRAGLELFGDESVADAWAEVAP